MLIRKKVDDLLLFFQNIKKDFSENQWKIAKNLISEIIFRLEKMIKLGLNYLTLNRTMATLSGGEAHRVHFSTQIGNQLSDITYVIDEPTTGLHPKDNQKLLSTIDEIRNFGNNIIIVDHDSFLIQNSDYIVDVGPNAGNMGGEIIYSGENIPNKMQEASFYSYIYGKNNLKHTYKEDKKENFNNKKDNYLKTKKMYKNNLKGVNILIPLNKLIGIFWSFRFWKKFNH